MTYPLDTPVPVSSDGQHLLKVASMGDDRHWYMHISSDGGQTWKFYSGCFGSQEQIQRQFDHDVEFMRRMFGYSEVTK